MIAHLRRFRLILPSEHGSWSLMLVPFVIGAGVAAGRPAPGAIPALLLGLAAALALFLARQPVTLLVRAMRGRARRGDALAARFWSILLLAAAGLAGIGLLALGRWAVLWLAIPALAVLAATLLIGVWRGPRDLAAELIGVAGLALAAPAAAVCVGGALNLTAWLVWAISAAHSVISVLYVRLRIDERHGRASQAQALAVVAVHALGLAAVIGAALLGWLPALIALPAGLLLLRALIVARRRPPLTDVRRFGFAEMGAALLFALLVIAAFLLWR